MTKLLALAGLTTAFWFLAIGQQFVWSQTIDISATAGAGAGATASLSATGVGSTTNGPAPGGELAGGASAPVAAPAQASVPVSAAASVAAPAPATGSPSNGSVSSEESKAYEDFKRSPQFIPAFDPELISIPKNQREFVIRFMKADMDQYRTILKEAIKKKNSFAPSVQILLKYSAKLITRLIAAKAEELSLSPRKATPLNFYAYIADMYDEMLNNSTVIKKEKGYTKDNVDTDDLYKRVDHVFNQVLKVIEVSPVGPYLKWHELVMDKSNVTSPYYNKRVLDEGADLGARFRAIGYDKVTFLAKRIVNLLRMFGNGLKATASSV